MAFSQWKNDALESINKAMENLTDIQKRRFEKCIIEGAGYNKIAIEENVTPAAIYKSGQNSIKKIRKYLSD